MDDPDLGQDLHDAALNGLARLNRLAVADRGFRRPLGRLLDRHDAGPVRILDLATGSGDRPVALDRWLARHRPDHERQWIGVDISDHALDRAADRATTAGMAFRRVSCNVLTDALPPCDIAMCSLFLHHLSHDEAVTCIRRLHDSARIGVVVGDLRRTRLGLVMAAGAARLTTRSPVVHADAPASVRAAFDDDEFAAILRDARIPDPAGSERVFPQRRIAWWWTTNAESPSDDTA